MKNVRNVIVNLPTGWVNESGFKMTLLKSDNFQRPIEAYHLKAYFIMVKTKMHTQRRENEDSLKMHTANSNAQ